MKQEKAESQKKLSILIPEDLHRDLKTYAFRNQTTISDVVLGKIKDLLDSDYKQVSANSQSIDEQIAG